MGLILFLIGLTLQLFAFFLSRQGVGLHPSIHYCVLFILTTSFWIVLNPQYCTLLFGNAPLLMFLDTIFVWLFTIFLFGYFGTFMQTGAKQSNDLLLFGLWFVTLLFLVLQLLGITDAYAVRQMRASLLMALKAAELEKKLVESHTAVMLSQIQPHFLYNTLASIKELCDTGEQQTTSKAYEEGIANSDENSGTGLPSAAPAGKAKPFILISALLALVSILDAVLAWIRPGKLVDPGCCPSYDGDSYHHGQNLLI